MAEVVCDSLRGPTNDQNPYKHTAGTAAAWNRRAWANAVLHLPFSVEHRDHLPPCCQHIFKEGPGGRGCPLKDRPP